MDKNKLIEAAAKLVQKGAYDKAIKEYQKVLDLDPKDVRVLQKMGELYQKKNDNGMAATFFSRVAETYSTDGFFLKAVALYKQVLKLSPGLVEVNMKLAELHQQLGLISEAMAYFQIVANHYDKVGDTRNSLDTLKRMVDLDPENVASRIKLAELYARENVRDEAVEEFRHAADYLKRHNRTDDYLRVCERISALVPDDTTLARELAASYLQRGDQKRALAKLQLCFKADPRDIETLGLLAEAFQGLGQTSKTLSVYKELAKIYTEANQGELANGVWNKVASIDPHDPDLVARRGGPPPPAAPPAAAPARAAASPAPAARTQTSAGPTQSSPRESLAKLLTETDVYVKYGLHDKALEHLRKVFNIDPENLEAHEKAYQIYVGSQHAAEAADQLLNVLRLMTRRAEVDRAQPYLRTILQQNPDHPEVPAFLAVLQKAGESMPPPDALTEDSLLLDTEQQEIVVGEPPDDGLGVAPEDLALASSDVPEEVVDEGEVLAPEVTAGDADAGFDTEGELEVGPEDLVSADDVSELPDEDPFEAPSPSPSEDEPLAPPEPVAPPARAKVLPPARAPEPPPPARVVAPPSRVLQPEPPTAAGVRAVPPSRAPSTPPTPPPARTPSTPPAPPPGRTSAPPAAPVARAPIAAAAPPAARTPSTPPAAAPKAPPPAAVPRVVIPPPTPAAPPGRTSAPPAARAPLAPVARAAPAAPPPRAAPPPPPPPPPATPAEDPVAQEVEEAGFLIDQGVLDEARDILETILLAHSNHPEATALLQKLEARAQAERTRTDMVVPQQESGSFDLAAELEADALQEESADSGVAIESAGEDFQYSVEEVFEEFKKGLEKVVKPEDVDTHYELGLAYKDMGLFDDAIKEFNVARQGCLGKKKEIDCLSSMGLVQIMKGDAAAAVKSFEEALANPVATGETAKGLDFELGIALETAGNLERALTYLQKVAALDPNYRGVSDAVTRVKAALPKTRKVGYL